MTTVNFYGHPFTATTDVQIALAQQIARADYVNLDLPLILPEKFPRQPPSDLQIQFANNYILTGNQFEGNATVPTVQIALAGQSGYITDGASVSTAVMEDASTGAVINNNPSGALLAAGGAANGQNGATFEGLAGVNQFITGVGGRDAVLLYGAANNLTSNGSDVVLVGGPSTITAAAGGTDSVTMVGGTSLAFINQSAGTTANSITGAANGIVLLAGNGTTSVTAGVGPEFFFVDTSAGNTTLNANASPNAAFTFIKDLPNSTARIQVDNLAAGDVIAIHGYAGFTIQGAATGGSMLALSDGTQITFSNLSTTTLQQTVRTV